MTQVTRRQHFVPQSYLRQWAGADGKVTLHDLASQTARRSGTKNVLQQSFFYEEDPNNPDNRIENLLGDMENRTGPIFKRIGVTVASSSGADRYGEKLTTALKKLLTKADVDQLSEFAAYQYLRVPGAIEQKDYELQIAMSDSHRGHALNPGRFVESGYAHIANRFKQMNKLFMTSPGREFVTSDWPCFDMKDSPDAPALGEEIGNSSDVVCYMPVSPRVGVVFLTSDFLGRKDPSPPVLFSAQSDLLVRNQNTLVIQQAERYVVATGEQRFIFDIAKKRKKGLPTP